MFHTALPPQVSLGSSSRSGGARFRRTLFVSALLALGSLATGHAGDPAPGVIPIGMSTALTGPAAVLGIGMKTGVELAFDEHNMALPPTHSTTATSRIVARRTCAR
jgi:ABC-type branched-subunit amino acid transport system substrate-binding protein